jgi:hypothetical protein
MVKCGVLFEVRTGFLNIIWRSLEYKLLIPFDFEKIRLFFRTLLTNSISRLPVCLPLITTIKITCKNRYIFLKLDMNIVSLQTVNTTATAGSCGRTEGRK